MIAGRSGSSRESDGLGEATLRGTIEVRTGCMKAGSVPIRRAPRSVSAGLFSLAIVACGILARPGPVGAQLPEVGPPIRVDVGGGSAAANETTVVGAGDPLQLVVGWNDWRESTTDEFIRVGAALSLDGGESWTDFLVRPPAPFQSFIEGDPMTAFDPITGSLWVGGISFFGTGGLFVARKDSGAMTFEPTVMAWVGGSADKGWMAAGPLPGQPLTTRLYLAFNEGIIASDDLGDTWSDLRDPDPIFGIGLLPRVGRDGELYISYDNVDTQLRLARSLDGGETYTDHLVAERMDPWSGGTSSARFPGTFRVPGWPAMAEDPTTGTLYVVFPDTTEMVGGSANVDLYFTRSLDQGESWTTPVVLNGDADPPGDQFFPWIEVDAEGRLHLVFLDSRNTPQDDGDADAILDVYYAFSLDAGQNWSEIVLTGSPWSSDQDGLDRPQQFIGDYLGLTVSGNVAHVAYLDTSAGDPDIFVREIEFPPFGGFWRGDASGDGSIGIEDPIANLDHIFLGGPALCLAAHDTNDDGSVGLPDPIYGLTFQFGSGPPPPEPFGACGPDPTGDPLECALYSSCP